MVIEKINPVGLDSVISKIQAVISQLQWGSLITIYPRCYRAERDGKTTIEHYFGNGEYERVIYAEGNKAFFEQVENISKENNNTFSTVLDVFFVLNLNDIYPNISHRADNEVHNDVLSVFPNVNTKSGIVEVDSLITDIQDVYNGLEYRQNDDIQPFHCFKVRLDIKFKLTQINCT